MLSTYCAILAEQFFFFLINCTCTSKTWNAFKLLSQQSSFCLYIDCACDSVQFLFLCVFLVTAKHHVIQRERVCGCGCGVCVCVVCVTAKL